MSSSAHLPIILISIYNFLCSYYYWAAQNFNMMVYSYKKKEKHFSPLIHSAALVYMWVWLYLAVFSTQYVERNQ